MTEPVIRHSREIVLFSGGIDQDWNELTYEFGDGIEGNVQLKEAHTIRLSRRPEPFTAIEQVPAAVLAYAQERFDRVQLYDGRDYSTVWTSPWWGGAGWT